MNLAAQIWTLLKKEWTLELRNKQSISALLVYSLATVFTVYLSVKTLPDRPWNAVFWVIILFVVMNAVNKIFFQESAERRLYFYTVADPIAIIFAKMLYNMGLVLLLSLIVFVVYSVLLPVNISQLWLYVLCIVFGATGLSSTLTMVTAITSKVSNNATLMAVLSFPIIIPMIMLIVNLSLVGFSDMSFGSVFPDLGALIFMDFLVFVLAYILFPYLWRD